MLINGVAGKQIAANDRGLMYGDGVFRTMLVQQGRVLHWNRQYHKLHNDCSELNIACPDKALLEADINQLLSANTAGVVKIIITRGTGSRGYAPQPEQEVTRIVSISPQPEYPTDFSKQGIQAKYCQMRLGHQPRLAGIKHLNRLENVLAANELSQTDYAEGILLDQSGLVIEGTRSNLFMVKKDILITPDLNQCGVAGVQKDRVMAIARTYDIKVKILPITPELLEQADEIFLVNSIIGLWPVRELAAYNKTAFPLSLQIQNWLNNETD